MKNIIRNTTLSLTFAFLGFFYTHAGEKQTISGTFEDGTEFILIADNEVIKPFEIVLSSGQDFEKKAVLKSLKRKGNNTCAVKYDDKNGKTFSADGNCRKVMKNYELIMALMKQ